MGTSLGFGEDQFEKNSIIFIKEVKYLLCLSSLLICCKITIKKEPPRQLELSGDRVSGEVRVLVLLGLLLCGSAEADQLSANRNYPFMRKWSFLDLIRWAVLLVVWIGIEHGPKFCHRPLVRALDDQLRELSGFMWRNAVLLGLIGDIPFNLLWVQANLILVLQHPLKHEE